MRLSIVIAVLDSSEVVRRQALWFKKMYLNPEKVELILVDDGSNPPLGQYPPFTIYRHNIPAQWTQPAARNYGVKQAKGEYLLVTDIDHIIPYSLIKVGLETTYDFIKFKREVAVLNKDGEFVQSEEAVKSYGYKKFEDRGFHIPPHTNSFIIKRDLYLSLGGVSEKYVGTGKYPNREEVGLRSLLKQMKANGEIKVLDDTVEGDPRPTIYMIPNGRFCGDKDYNPFGLFHTLKRGEPERTRLTNKEKARLRREGR